MCLGTLPPTTTPQAMRTNDRQKTAGVLWSRSNLFGQLARLRGDRFVCLRVIMSLHGVRSSRNADFRLAGADSRRMRSDLSASMGSYLP
jgi:hypothetical protein